MGLRAQNDPLGQTVSPLAQHESVPGQAPGNYLQRCAGK